MAHNGAPATPGLLHQQLETPSRVDEITDRLITAIAIGEYLPGARLPVERDLATSLGAGRMTVRAALARLVERGLLETRRGRGGGSYVLDQWPESSTDVVGRTLRARLDELRDRCDAICRLQGVLKQLLLDLKATVSIGAPAHLWGEPSTMRSMELRALREHEQLVRAISDRRGDDADELARHHGAIDFELITTAMRRAGVLTD